MIMLGGGRSTSCRLHVCVSRGCRAHAGSRVTRPAANHETRVLAMHLDQSVSKSMNLNQRP